MLYKVQLPQKILQHMYLGPDLLCPVKLVTQFVRAEDFCVKIFHMFRVDSTNQMKTAFKSVTIIFEIYFQQENTAIKDTSHIKV